MIDVSLGALQAEIRMMLSHWDSQERRYEQQWSSMEKLEAFRGN